MLIKNDKSMEDVIRKVDPEANLERVLYAVIVNGVKDEDRLLWTRRRKIFGWTAVFLFVLYQFFSRFWPLSILYIVILGFWAGSSSFINDNALVVQDERGFTLYVLNKWQTKVAYIYPLNLAEMESSTPLERIIKKRTAHLHLYVKEKYFHVIISQRTLGLKKQKGSFQAMMPVFIQETYRKDLDPLYFGEDKYDARS